MSGNRTTSGDRLHRIATRSGVQHDRFASGGQLIQTGRWELTKAALDKLLVQFDSDPECAGERYELTRAAIIKFFECRGCANALDLADETINRVARKVWEGSEIRADNLSAYFYGVARNVRREHLRNAVREPIPIETLAPHQQPCDETAQSRSDLEEKHHTEQRLACLETCVERLPVETRSLILSYYEGEEGAKIANRKRLAEQLKIPLSNLRIRVHRIREKLETCLSDCLRQSRRDEMELLIRH